MYGTVARMKVKASEVDGFQEKMQEIGVGLAPGQRGVFVYQMDQNSRELFLAVIFESREAYIKNANSPEQHERFMKVFALLEGEPEWHDGEIIYSVFE